MLHTIPDQQQLFESYLQALRQQPLDRKTEHTDRTALENLLKGLAAGRPGISVQHEPRREGEKGSPDFKIMADGLILGYVEVKKIGADLNHVLKSPQIAKYKTLGAPLILTDYLHFIWIALDTTHHENLCWADDVENPRFKLKSDRVDALAQLLDGFLNGRPQPVARAEALADHLARRAHVLHNGLLEELNRQESQNRQGKLHGLYEAFKTQVFHDLTLNEFADVFAQMLAYGLFLAKLNAEASLVTLDNARTYVPNAFSLIRELVDFTTELAKPEYAPLRWVVDQILSVLNGMDLAGIRKDLSFSGRKTKSRNTRAGSEEEHRLFERDPFVYFYEDFLGRYDKKLKKSRGVYYTPPPIVSFIVRAIDDILRGEFGIADGLADHRRVKLLDFACGTGTFMLEALEKMFETVGESEARRGLLVREHILKNVYGFEYLIAPYTIAHLKLSQWLKEKGYPLEGEERLGIYLTNTLEPIAPQRDLMLPALSAEAQNAQAVKDRDILVITGNPPYAGHSKNPGQRIILTETSLGKVRKTIERTFIGRLIDTYKFVDGKPLGEKNSKWLNDDYVKFIRFAQMKIDAEPQGVIGIITNHSFLDNATFRGMRQSLMQSFDKIYVLDLHGSAKKKETTPDGLKDENVFDIEQGVAISLFVKTGKPKAERKVFVADLWGKQLAKYETAARTDFRDVAWEEITPTTPFYLFGRQSVDTDYDSWPSVPSIFPVNSVGIVTARDNLTIHFDSGSLMKTVHDFASREVEDARQFYDLGRDVDDWKIHWAQTDLIQNKISEIYDTKILYRPFDIRQTYYTGKSRGFICRPRTEIMRHMMRDNIALGIGRAGAAIPERPWELILACNTILDANAYRRGLVNIYPLHAYASTNGARKFKTIELFGDADPFAGKVRIENIGPAFRTWLEARYVGQSNEAISPEDIFGCIYAILHAPTYRAKYQEFLRRDFPRIPFPEKRADFDALAKLGWDLAQKHLLKDVPRPNLYQGKGDNSVEKPRWSEAEQALYINATQYFAPVPENVWQFVIGGYQVLDKFLKSRKGRKLSLDEITTIEQIVWVLGFTIKRMEEIDKAYNNAFAAS